jgi:uncharacterized protein (TIGR00725 family)
MNVTVFGGARPRPGEPEYLQAVRLGSLLGKAGHTVLTGGYTGTMEAVSRGASEAGAHVIGVTCREIEAWRPSPANPWVKEERKMDTLEARITALINGCDAALALPGGCGTLAEVSILWNRLLIEAASPRKVILIGAGWKTVFETLFKEQPRHLDENDTRWLLFANTVEDAVKMLENA